MITTQLTFILRPFITAGKSAPPFPLAVCCPTKETANNISRLQSTVQALLRFDPPLTPRSLGQELYKNALVSDILHSYSTQEPSFTAIYLGHRIGIFFTWYEISLIILICNDQLILN